MLVKNTAEVFSSPFLESSFPLFLPLFFFPDGNFCRIYKIGLLSIGLALVVGYEIFLGTVFLGNVFDKVKLFL